MEDLLNVLMLLKKHKKEIYKHKTNKDDFYNYIEIDKAYAEELISEILDLRFDDAKDRVVTIKIEQILKKEGK